METQILFYILGLLSVTESTTIENGIIKELLYEIKQLKASVAANTDQIHELTKELRGSKARVLSLESLLEDKSEQIRTLQQVVLGAFQSQWTNSTDNILKAGINNSAYSLYQNSINRKLDLNSNIVKNAQFESATAVKYSNDILHSHGNIQRKGDFPAYHQRDTPQQNFTTRGRIAFSASLSVTPTELGREHTIPFDKILVNSGNGFNIVTHMFECPLNGIYFFHAALSSVYHDYIETELVRDGVVLARMYAAGDTRDFPFGFDQGANAIVTMCNVGEHVWVRVREHVGTALSTGEFTTFAGFLLFEM